MVDEKKQDIRVLFWGMMGEFSLIVLQGLLEAGIIPAAIMIPASITAVHHEPILRVSAAPLLSQIPLGLPQLPRSITELGQQKEIPIYELRRLSSTVVAGKIATLEPDVAVVACFPWRIPAHLLAVPRSGFLNLHPSLLPELRGPFPQFWAFRLGSQHTGITVHHMDSQLDTGDIALQQALAFPDGISGPEADQILAVNGASLLVKSLKLLMRDELPRVPQPAGGSHYSRPRIEDFRVPTSWPARRAFNFMRGTAEWHHPFHIVGPDINLTVRQALSFTADARQPEPLQRGAGDYWIQFTPGLLHAR